MVYMKYLCAEGVTLDTFAIGTDFREDEWNDNDLPSQWIDISKSLLFVWSSFLFHKFS